MPVKPIRFYAFLFIFLHLRASHCPEIFVYNNSGKTNSTQLRPTNQQPSFQIANRLSPFLLSVWNKLFILLVDIGGDALN